MNNWYDILAMTQVDHRLFVSGYARAAELAEKNPHKITAVLCVHQVMDYKKNPDIIYRHIPFNDGEKIPERQFAECLGWMKFMYENGHKILVHCAAGISRSVTILASFMHYEDICDYREALHRIKLNRPNADPAATVKASAAEMLHAWPYNNPEYISTPEHETTMQDAMFDLTERIQNVRAAEAHTNLECPMRTFLLGNHVSNVPRHEIPCNCEKLVNPMEIATERDKLIVPEHHRVIQPEEKKIIIQVGSQDIKKV
jgi:protein-tyrosine phosphatase